MSVPNTDNTDTTAPSAPNQAPSPASVPAAPAPQSSATPTDDPADKPGYVNGLPENAVIDPNNQPESTDKDAAQ